MTRDNGEQINRISGTRYVPEALSTLLGLTGILATELVTGSLIRSEEGDDIAIVPVTASAPGTLIIDLNDRKYWVILLANKVQALLVIIVFSTQNFEAPKTLPEVQAINVRDKSYSASAINPEFRCH